MNVKKIVGILLISLLIVVPICFLTQAQTKPRSKVIYLTSNPSNYYDKALIGWVKYLSASPLEIVSFTELPTDLAYFDSAIVVIAHNIYFSSFSEKQKSALNQYVLNGGNLFVGGRVDAITNSWFGTSSLPANVPASNLVFPSNSFLNFSDLLDPRVGSVLSKYTGYGYFSEQELPSTIVSVVQNPTGEGLIYTGTLGQGKIVFMPNLWFWSLARGYPSIHSPFVCALLNYLLSDYHRPMPLRSTESVVCLRVDDVYGWTSDVLLAVTNAFKTHAVTNVTFGIIPIYTANQALKTELSSVTNCELAMHGDSTGHSDIVDYTYSEAYEKLCGGLDMMKSNFGITPQVYLTPYERQANPDVLLALKDLNLTIGGGGNTNYYLDSIPDGPIDASLELTFVTSSLSSYLQEIFYYEHLRMLGNPPFVVLLHPNTDVTYLNELIDYFESRRAVFATISQAVNMAKRTLPLSNIYFEGDGGIVSYEWAIDEYNAEITVTSSRNGWFYINCVHNIESADINGVPCDFSGNVLKLPMMYSGFTYTINVKFGDAPPKPPSADFTETSICVIPGQPALFSTNFTITNNDAPTLFTVSNSSFSGNYKDYCSVISGLPVEQFIASQWTLPLVIRVDVPSWATEDINVTLQVQVTCAYSTQVYHVPIQYKLSGVT